MSRLTRIHALAFMTLALLLAAALRLPDLLAAPPGLHYDEAANAILAAEIGLQGQRPLFISSYTGKEVLFFYLAGGLMRLIGPSLFALRLTAAFVGLLTVAATYWLGREMLADRRVALLAAALLATSFWHLLFSRLGFRAITEPLLQALTVAALFRGLRRDAWPWLLASGALLGLTAYTYLAARLFPLLLLLAALPLLVDRATARRRRRQLALWALVGFVVLSPLLLYFANHPDAFWVRIGQVAPGTAGSALTLQASLLKSLGMFFLVGDPFWRFNLPQRPLFNWFWGGLLLLGWLVCLWRLRRLPYDWQRAALALLAAAPLVMLLPTALAVNEIVPSNLRAIGLIPFLFYLPALGLVVLLHDLERRFRNPPVTFAALFVGLLVLFSGGLAAWQAYFQTWARDEQAFYAADGDLTAVAAYLDQADLRDKSVYLSALHYRHPTIAFLSPHYAHVKWLPQSQALVFPPQGAALLIYPYNSPAPEWAAPYLAAGVPLDAPPTRPGQQPPFSAYLLTRPADLAIPTPVDVNFGDAVTLLGYELGAGRAGATLPLTLFWRIDSAPAADFNPFVHLEDAFGHRWGQVETFAYPAEQWTPGEIVIQRVDVPVPPGAPPDAYRLRVGLFAAADNQRLPRLDADGRYAGDAFFIEAVAIAAGAPRDPLPAPPFPVGETALPGLRLVGYARGAPAVAAGDRAGLALWWLAGAPLPPLTARFELLRADGTGRIVADTQPVYGRYPFDRWATPQFVIDHQWLRIPADFPPGDYRLHLRLLDAADASVYTADLGPLTVEATPRSFAPPDVAYPLNATLGGEIGLLGYDLAAGETPRSAALTLVWQARAVPAADYTVFVHLLRLDGSCCAWQQDLMPRQGQYPTTRWLPDEVVVDTYAIALPADAPAGAYPLEVGLYIAETGQRLLVEVPGLPARDAVTLRPWRVEVD